MIAASGHVVKKCAMNTSPAAVANNIPRLNHVAAAPPSALPDIPAARGGVEAIQKDVGRRGEQLWGSHQCRNVGPTRSIGRVLWRDSRVQH